tara:strand:- start:202 stop:579 length:378 start_codon:yes stop_codon:yes gene_type:complete
MTTEGNKLLGQVKWFNNQLNYGFITVISEGEHNGVDVFVHQTSVTPQVSNYRTLTQGEYVSFVFSENENEKHPYHATNVTGVNGGKLMCDFYDPNRRRNHNNSGSNSHNGGHRSNNRNNNSSRND